MYTLNRNPGFGLWGFIVPAASGVQKAITIAKKKPQDVCIGLMEVTK